MKLYYAKHTCAVGIHLLLEEIGVPYETHRLDFGKDEQHGDAFTRINPKGKVPVIERDDGTALTEFGTIAWWLGTRFPDAKLVPADLEQRTRADELVAYVTGTSHGQGFGRIFVPQRFTPEKSDFDEVKKAGVEMVNKGFSIIADSMLGSKYFVGDFSIADAALFYIENWAQQLEETTPVRLPEKLRSHLKNMEARPSVKRALAQGRYNM